MRILTAPGERFEVTQDLRNMLVLLDDGALLVAKSYATNPHVRGFIFKLKQLGFDHRMQLVDLSVIESHYDAKNTQRNPLADQSDMQRAARTLFEKAVKLRASDIHIRVSRRARTHILFRVNNDLEVMEEHHFEYGAHLCTTIYQSMADVSDSTFEQLSRQDARISERTHLPHCLDGIRIATSPQVEGYIMVLRLLYNDTSGDFDLSGLGYAPRQIEATEQMKKRPTGVIVIGGPTGSGKSTTLQRVLASIIHDSQGRRHIITVEDPPEYPIPGAVQTPVTNVDSEEDRSREYQKAVKAAMRLDPDIIMLSEVRDRPTARLVIQAAMTGHQVWTTVHANSALAILDRLTDLGVQPELLSDPTIVSGLICQRLLKKLCTQCKTPLSENHAKHDPRDIHRVMSVLGTGKVYVQGNGCTACRGSGIAGRTVVAETVVTDNQLTKLIRAGDRLGALEYVRSEQGSITMLDHAIHKIGEGLVDPFQAEEIVGPLNASLLEHSQRAALAELAERIRA